MEHMGAKLVLMWHGPVQCFGLRALGCCLGNCGCSLGSLSLGRARIFCATSLGFLLQGGTDLGLWLQGEAFTVSPHLTVSCHDGYCCGGCCRHSHGGVP
ncbi:hypothetical protein ACFX14_013225 [Malus domestica]